MSFIIKSIKSFTLPFVLLMFLGSVAPAQNLGTYHDYDALTATLQSYANAYPNLIEVGTLGQSVQGRELWYARITDNLSVEEDEPEFRYISTMHGDEVTGVEMSLYFIDHLLSNYGTDARVTNLVNSTDITIVPLMNPDGRTAGQRLNANFVDLNRNFPEGSTTNLGNVVQGPPIDTSGVQPETQAIMEWGAANRFTLSANFHGGALVVNYPYDSENNGSVYAPAPDDELFVHISEVYSQPNAPMWNSSIFPNGVTNGAQWYEVQGGMQDWSYRYLGDNHVTIELSEDKWPDESELPAFWAENQESMLAFAEQAQIGIRGLLRDATTGQPIEGIIEVAGNERVVFNDADVGDYHRMLLPGTYDLNFYAAGYVSTSVANIQVLSGDATRVDVLLEPLVEPSPGDFNGDGFVDSEDLLVWQSNFGILEGAFHSQGDSDRDNDVDGTDFLLWQANYGSLPSQIVSTLPEPSSICLLAVFLLSSFCSRFEFESL